MGEALTEQEQEEQNQSVQCSSPAILRHRIAMPTVLEGHQDTSWHCPVNCLLALRSFLAPQDKSAAKSHHRV